MGPHGAHWAPHGAHGDRFWSEKNWNYYFLCIYKKSKEICIIQVASATAADPMPRNHLFYSGLARHASKSLILKVIINSIINNIINGAPWGPLGPYGAHGAPMGPMGPLWGPGGPWGSFRSEKKKLKIFIFLTFFEKSLYLMFLRGFGPFLSENSDLT